jgi:hypothetical protein
VVLNVDKWGGLNYGVVLSRDSTVHQKQKLLRNNNKTVSEA